MGFSSNTWTISLVLSVWTQVIIKGWNYQLKKVQPNDFCVSNIWNHFWKVGNSPCFFFKYNPICFICCSSRSLNPISTNHFRSFLFEVKESTSVRRSLPLSPVTWWEYQTPPPPQMTRPKSWGWRRQLSHDLFKKHPGFPWWSFPWNNWLGYCLWNNPYFNWEGFHPLYTWKNIPTSNQGPLFFYCEHLSWRLLFIQNGHKSTPSTRQTQPTKKLVGKWSSWFFILLQEWTGVVGGFNPFEKYDRQIGSFPQIDEHIKYLKLPPSGVVGSILILNQFHIWITLLKLLGNTNFNSQTQTISCPVSHYCKCQSKWKLKDLPCQRVKCIYIFVYVLYLFFFWNGSLCTYQTI